VAARSPIQCPAGSLVSQRQLAGCAGAYKARAAAAAPPGLVSRGGPNSVSTTISGRRIRRDLKSSSSPPHSALRNNAVEWLVPSHGPSTLS
jgi:hypothetical protein